MARPRPAGIRTPGRCARHRSGPNTVLRHREALLAPTQLVGAKDPPLECGTDPSRHRGLSRTRQTTDQHEPNLCAPKVTEGKGMEVPRLQGYLFPRLFGPKARHLGPNICAGAM